MAKLLVFAGLPANLFLNVCLHRHSLNPETTAATVVAFNTIFTRCAYRIPELAEGWANPIMRNENKFLILDNMYIACFFPPR